MHCSSEEVTYSVINLEVGHLDKNVSAFSRVTLEYLTLSATLSLFAWGIKDWRYAFSCLVSNKKNNHSFHGYSWLHDFSSCVFFSKLSCTSVTYMLSFQDVKASRRNNNITNMLHEMCRHHQLLRIMKKLLQFVPLICDQRIIRKKEKIIKKKLT